MKTFRRIYREWKKTFCAKMPTAKNDFRFRQNAKQYERKTTDFSQTFSCTLVRFMVKYCIVAKIAFCDEIFVWTVCF